MGLVKKEKQSSMVETNKLKGSEVHGEVGEAGTSSLGRDSVGFQESFIYHYMEWRPTEGFYTEEWHDVIHDLKMVICLLCGKWTMRRGRGKDDSSSLLKIQI